MSKTTATLFKVNPQQWFAIDSIEAIDDYGDDIGVTLKGGRTHRVAYRDRDRFLAIISALTA